jgi:hypothetical protein
MNEMTQFVILILEATVISYYSRIGYKTRLQMHIHSKTNTHTCRQKQFLSSAACNPL